MADFSNHSITSTYIQKKKNSSNFILYNIFELLHLLRGNLVLPVSL